MHDRNTRKRGKQHTAQGIPQRGTKTSVQRFRHKFAVTTVVVKWLDCDKTKMTGRVIELPHREDIDLDVEEHLIVPVMPDWRSAISKYFSNWLSRTP